MNKGNKSSFWLTFSMPGIAGLVFGASTIITPLQAQTLPSTATSTPNTTSSTPSWIEQSNPLIGWIVGIVTGIVSVVTSMNLVERKNQHIGELGEQIKGLEKENDFVNKLIIHLATQSENLKNMVEQLSEHPDIATLKIYQELRQQIDEYCKDIATAPQTINAHREAKRWLVRKRVQNLLFKSTLTKTLQFYIEEFGTVNKLEENEIKKDIRNCLNLLLVSLSEGTDVRKTKINNSEIVSTTQAIQSCVKALNYIKTEELLGYVSKCINLTLVSHYLWLGQ
jgi:uncharacterized membrane-anchored protein YhcB (DUF1043 family)